MFKFTIVSLHLCTHALARTLFQTLRWADSLRWISYAPFSKSSYVMGPSRVFLLGVARASANRRSLAQKQRKALFSDQRTERSKLALDPTLSCTGRGQGCFIRISWAGRGRGGVLSGPLRLRGSGSRSAWIECCAQPLHVVSKLRYWCSRFT